MDFIAMSILYGVFAFFKFVIELIGKNAGTSQGRGNGDQSAGLLAGYFMFDETRGVNQKDDDPYLNSEYDDGPDWG